MNIRKALKKLKLLILTLTWVGSSAQSPELWGITNYGGSNSLGTLYKIKGDGSGFAVVHTFTASPTGEYPNWSLLQVRQSGSLYGMAGYGGTYASGVIFKIDTLSNSFSVVHDFNDTAGALPYGDLMQAGNGLLYGITHSSAGGYGEFFSLDPVTSSFTAIHNFSSSDGEYSMGTPAEASNGKIYGATTNGAANGLGAIYCYDPTTNIFNKIYDLTTSGGTYPFGEKLLSASNGLIYGLMGAGGANNGGTIFSFDVSTNIYTKLFDFSNSTGSAPGGSLIQATNGLLYGMTFKQGANGGGTIFSFNLSGNIFTKLYDFTSLNGKNPLGSLMQASDGNLYGVTDSGGVSNMGVVFKFAIPLNSYTKIFDFNGINGQTDQGGLIELKSLGNGIREEQGNSLLIYPNPANNSLNLHFSNADMIGKEVSLHDISGAIVLKQKIYSTSQPLNISELSPGTYFLNYLFKGQSVNKKIVIR